MARVVVVTGTDTDVGKTFVTAALCHALVERGVRVRALKPVESGVAGAEPGPAEDGVILARATGQPWPSAALQRYEAPLAPPVAANLASVPIRDDEWRDAVARLAQDADLVFVEAAGGLLSPLSERFDARILAEHLDASLLIVGRDALGTINHTRLVLEAAGNLDIVGVILSAPAHADASTGRNVDELRRVTGQRRIVSIGRFEAPPIAAHAMADVVAWFDDIGV